MSYNYKTRQEEEAEAAVEAIIEDIRGRSGIKHEWNGIDADIQDEIRKVWGRIILSHMRRVK